MDFPYFHVDAFADRPFSGNRAGVCLPERPLDTSLMQGIAKETGLAVTAFVQEGAHSGGQDGGQGGGPEFRLQWFSPVVELPLCGHGTLAAAHILWEQGRVGRASAINFRTPGGRLTVRGLVGDWIEMDFPAFGASAVALPAELIGLFPEPLAVVQSNHRLLIELDGEEKIRDFVPDFERLREHHVIITSSAAGGSPYDFVSRFFAGPVGVPEDPVTGSAHCSLGPYWAEKLGKRDMVAYQASERGGVMKVRLEKDRALLAGQAVTVVKGRMAIL